MKTISVLLFALLAAGWPLAHGAESRSDTVLDLGWKFRLGDPAGAARPDYDDGAWQAISLPHNWGWSDAHLGKTYYRGPGWYRRRLDAGPPETGRRYFLRFEAASEVAEVYLNGKLLGTHEGGFGAFCFEVTSALSPGGSNELAVRVSNAWEPELAPLSGDFSIYGGLYRPVHLIATGMEDICLTDHGSPGVAWRETEVSAEEAVIDMTAEVSNGASTTRRAILTATIRSERGKPLLSQSLALELAPGAIQPAQLRLILPHPHLWDGRRDPYCYRADLALTTADGGAVDSIEQPLGLRFYRVDPDRGFFLNGRPYPIHGVDRHQDRPVEGWAITAEDMKQDLALMEEMGCTAVRCAHYEHSDAFYSLCDRAGMLVWAEIPQVHQVPSIPAFEEASAEQLRDLVRQNINHPSIFAWSLFNELKPAPGADPRGELRDLNALAHREDPTRPTIAATNTDKLPEMNKIPDLLGWNLYPGWYKGFGDDMGAVLDAKRDTSRHGGFCVSEYGAGANIAQHEIPPKKPKTTGDWHPEEWQNEVHEADWAAIRARPFVWGSFVWAMFDFAVSTRHEGGQPGLNDKGLVTYDRRTRKDAFYFYKANWSDEPVLYITSRRFADRTDAITEVKVYTNAPSAELFVNGASLGRRDRAIDGVLSWKDVRLAPGANTVWVEAMREGRRFSDRCVWNLRPAK
jgi:beta-galactosidase